MLDLIGSNEFGDWLLEELSQAQALSQSAHAAQAQAAQIRWDRLEVAKKVLLEFLILQQHMMDAASAARSAKKAATAPV